MKKWQTVKAVNDDGNAGKKTDTADILPFGEPIKESRRRSLEACMDATLFTTMEDIQRGGEWRLNERITKLEDELHAVYMDVLHGIRKLVDYRCKAEEWKGAGTVLH